VADLATLAPTGTSGRLGHFLPYLLQRRLRAVLWPADNGERLVALLLLAVAVAYGVGLGFLLRIPADGSELAQMVPRLIVGLNAIILGSALVVDFMPALRRVVQPMPEHFPVPARLRVLTAFLLDLLTLRRLTMAAGLVAALVISPKQAAVPGLALLLLLGSAMLSFNVRFLVAIGRWRHPLLFLHLLSLALMGGWISLPELPHHAALGWAVGLLPFGLGATQLYLLGPYFSARFLPDTAATAAAGELLARFSPEWKAYLRKVWLPLLIGTVFKIIIIAGAGIMARKGDLQKTGFFAAFFFAFLPAVGFTYVNNNLFGFLRTMVANELHRVGLTRRVLALYLRLAGPVVLTDSLLSAGLLLAFFPSEKWWLLGLLPLAVAALLSIGLWGSLYQSKQVARAVDFANMRNNVSTMMSLCTMAVATTLYFLPWWWARIALALVVTASAYWPIRAVLRNDGSLRRKLWHGIGA
jgi:hypothetical protein